MRAEASGESRGGAPKGERVPLDARRGDGWMGGNARHPDAANGWMRLSALRLPSFWEVLEISFCKTSGANASRER